MSIRFYLRSLMASPDNIPITGRYRKNNRYAQVNDLLLSISTLETKLGAPGYPSGNFLVLNPFTMQKEVMKIDVPPRRWWVDQVYPDPSLSYCVIQPDDAGTGYQWRFLRSDGWQTLWQGISSSFNEPDWSPDGRFLAIGVSRIEKGKYYDHTNWDTALIDLQEFGAYRLVKEVIPQAWKRKPY